MNLIPYDISLWSSIEKTMSSNSGIPNESNLPDFTPPSITTLVGVALGMVILLVLLRKVISIFVIDMCLLGDCSSFKKIFCCFRGSRDGDRQNDMDNTGTSWPNRWRSRDAILFERIGAFNDPFAFIYGDKVSRCHASIRCKSTISHIHITILSDDR